jgi:hypothetical protein
VGVIAPTTLRDHKNGVCSAAGVGAEALSWRDVITGSDGTFQSNFLIAVGAISRKTINICPLAVINGGC